MANESTQKRRDGDPRNDRNPPDGAERATEPDGSPGPGRDREAVRRGEASQQTHNDTPPLKPATPDQAAHGNQPVEERKR